MEKSNGFREVLEVDMKIAVRRKQVSRKPYRLCDMCRKEVGDSFPEGLFRFIGGVERIS
jgi:hypothetical protein